MWRFACILLLATLSLGFKPRNRPPPESANCTIKYYTTVIDHFSFVNGKTFDMKYLICMESWKTGGPIFFYTGNEGAIESFAANSGFMFDLAKELSAAVLFGEHRYYGTSLPFHNDSFTDKSHFGYLTADQALADYAEFLQDFKRLNPQFESSPVISFGGSYGGMLTAWFRQKYPNVVAGGLAASAPVWMFPGMSDCGGFAQVTTDAYRKGGDRCASTVRRTWDIIDNMASSAEGLHNLSAAFNTCLPLNSSLSLYSFASDFLVSLAMMNYPYDTSFLMKLPGWPVKVFCKHLADGLKSGDDSSTLQAFATAIRKLESYNSTSHCLELSPKTGDINGDIWDLQTCMDMTMAMCADGKRDMFKPQLWNPVMFSDACYAKYGIRPRMQWTDSTFWGHNLESLTNVIFSNGDLDPWSAFGVLNNSLAPHATIVRITTGAHHLDLRAAHPLDTEEVKVARKLETHVIRKWITKWKSAHGFTD